MLFFGLFYSFNDFYIPTTVSPPSSLPSPSLPPSPSPPPPSFLFRRGQASHGYKANMEHQVA